jgi:hypothetical protein
MKSPLPNCDRNGKVHGCRDATVHCRNVGPADQHAVARSMPTNNRGDMDMTANGDHANP